MTVKDIADLITENKYSFHVEIPGINFRHPKMTFEQAISDCGSIENCLNNIAHANKAKHLLIRFGFLSGGINNSSLREKGKEIISFPETESVENSQKTVREQSENSQKTVVKQSENSIGTVENHSEIQKQTPLPTKNPMEAKDYIDFKVLQSEHKRLEHIYDESKARINKLEKKVEDLHDENKQLLRENLTKEDKHELALERARLEMDKESKAGLSGLMGELSANPQLIEAIMGIINPKHPMFNKEPQLALEGAPDNNGNVKYTEDPEANNLLNDIPRVLSQKDGNTMVQIYLLFQEFVNKPDILKKVVDEFLPNYPS